MAGSCEDSPNTILYTWACETGENESDDLTECDDPEGIFVEDSET